MKIPSVKSGVPITTQNNTGTRVFFKSINQFHQKHQQIPHCQYIVIVYHMACKQI